MAHAKPFVMVVESDPNLIQRLVGDLERAYGTRYRVLGDTSPSRALEKLRQLRLDQERVALVLAEAHLLTEAQQLFPDVKRIQLCAPTQVEEARDALRRRQADDFLVKPCQPPDKNLYPMLDDLLSDWDRHRSAAVGALRVVGYRFSPESHQARDFLARNCVRSNGSTSSGMKRRVRYSGKRG